jgi:hypothetical protein
MTLVQSVPVSRFFELKPAQGWIVMPHIRYRGGRPPTSIAEHVSYEDPNAPCKKGLAELMAEGRRFTEKTYDDRVERANRLEDYLNSHQYPGLEYRLSARI